VGEFQMANQIDAADLEELVSDIEAISQILLSLGCQQRVGATTMRYVC
jgi:hypothetical protein